MTAEFLLLLPLAFSAPSTPGDRAIELKKYLDSQRPLYEANEVSRRGLLEELDAINANQNKVREGISDIQLNRRELSMAHENLSMEYKKQTEVQRIEKGRIVGLARFLYKIKHDGFFRFVVKGENLAQLAGRIRVLYRTFRSHAELTRKLDERAERLKVSQKKIAIVHQELEKVLGELGEQERILGRFLKRKREMVSQIAHRQSTYQRMVREYRQLMSEVSQLFLELPVVPSPPGLEFPRKRSLPLPIAIGKIVRGFGKNVHEQFGTVVYHKGIEIAAEHNTPVNAVFNGTVEFVGWLKGMGNVLILNHGRGIYSLSGHLFKFGKGKGDTVTQGDTVGWVGDTGGEDHPSLYFEIRENGKAVNPIAYFAKKYVQEIL